MSNGGKTRMETEPRWRKPTYLEGESQIQNPVFGISFASLGNNVGAAFSFYHRRFLGNGQKSILIFRTSLVLKKRM